MKHINGEEVEIVSGNVDDVTKWIANEPLPVTLRRGDFRVTMRTENQRKLFVAGLTLGAELTVAMLRKPCPN